MPTFPSEEWLREYVDRINSSAKFADAARTFEADIAYVFERDPEFGAEHDVWSRARFADGRCEWAKFDIQPADGADANFIIRGPYSQWKAMIRGEADPMESMLDGDLVVTGHLPTLLKYVRAADELVNLAASVSTSFADEIRP